MNEEIPDQADTHELALDQIRLLGDLLSCLEAAGYDPKDTQELQLILAAHLRHRRVVLSPGRKKAIRHCDQNRMMRSSTAWTLPR